MIKPKTLLVTMTIEKILNEDERYRIVYTSADMMDWIRTLKGFRPDKSNVKLVHQSFSLDEARSVISHFKYYEDILSYEETELTKMKRCNDVVLAIPSKESTEYFPEKKVDDTLVRVFLHARYADEDYEIQYETTKHGISNLFGFIPEQNSEDLSEYRASYEIARIIALSLKNCGDIADFEKSEIARSKNSDIEIFKR